MSRSWPIVPLIDCLRERPDYGANAPSVPYDPALPRYVRITDIRDDGALLDSDPVSIRREDATGTILAPGDLLFARSGATVGKTYLHQDGAREHAFAGYLIRVRPRADKLLPEFLALYTRSQAYKHWLSRTARAGAQPNISAREYSQLPVPRPPIADQVRIIGAIRAWTKVDAILRRLLLAKRRLKRGLMEELLTGKRRFQGFEGQSWTSMTIGDLFEVVSRPVEWDDSAAYDLLSIRRRSGGVFHRSRTEGHKIKTKQLFQVRERDFLISRMQVVHGALGLVPPEFDGMHVSGSYVVLHNKNPDTFRVEFFDQLTRLPSMYRQALLASYGVHIEKMTFNLEWYLKAEIQMPSSLGEQDAIVSTLTAMDREITALERLQAAIDRQRRGVMELLLTAKVGVPA